jgi:hypothetical protein
MGEGGDGRCPCVLEIKMFIFGGRDSVSEYSS